MREWVEVREEYHKRPDGTCFMLRYVGGKLISGPDDILPLCRITIPSVWPWQVERPLALVKEGPKSLIRVAG